MNSRRLGSRGNVNGWEEDPVDNVDDAVGGLNVGQRDVG